MLGEEQDMVVRLAPTAFLPHNEILVRVGDTVAVKGLRVSTAASDILAATEIRRDDRPIALRGEWRTAHRQPAAVEATVI